MSLANIITLLGGIALFLFGMSLMGDGLKKVAGSSMEVVLYRLSGTPLKGLALGTFVTAVIQSSSATSVMVVGFVNSGMMNMTQAAAVIQGALIGTSVTGWIICLSYIGGAGGIASLLSTSTIAAFFAIIGIGLRMFSKRQRSKYAGDILLGFTVLMFGMQSMSGAVSPLRESESFLHLLTTFSNPLVGILVGALFTAVLQSASAAVGILQALSLTGAIRFDIAFPLLLGITVGAALPVLLSSIGAKGDGKRTALLYLLLGAFSSLLAALVYYPLAAFGAVEVAARILDPVGIAAVNTLFRAVTAPILLLLHSPIIRLTRLIIKTKESESRESVIFDRLDERFLTHPTLALEQSRLTVNDMANTAMENFLRAADLLAAFSEEGYRAIAETEDLVDRYEDKLGTYLVKLNVRELSERQNDDASKYLHNLSDLERIGDHAMNIAEVAQEISEKKLSFSGEAKRELDVLLAAVESILRLSVGTFISGDLEQAYAVEPLEERIDVLCDEMKLRHVDRLQSGECSLQQGFVFNDLLTNFERVADHCSNLAVAMIELSKDDLDTHDYIINLKELHAHRFDEYYEQYSEQFKI